jgi:rhodanese-related sulfurtransferase
VLLAPSDVREPDEVMLGSIPSSVNVPLSNFEKALDMDESDFLRAYGFRKPKKDQKLIFYCKAGVRAGSAAGLAKDKGWKQVRNYPGSWDEVGRPAPLRRLTSDPCCRNSG